MPTPTRSGLWMAAVAASCLLLPTLANAQAAAPSAPAFTTLGTNSGPIPNPQRAEPANLLQVGDQNILIDVGDGAPWQLAKAGVPLGKVHTILISHLHFDHTGGLFAFISQRYQILEPSPVTIYGPPGTKALVASLIDAISKSTEGANNMRGFAPGGPADNIEVIELADGSQVTLGEVKVTVARNTHYAATAGGDDPRYSSFSFRFDTPGRSIVYTGDTGPSPAVEALARGADLLVCEIMDPDIALTRAFEKHPEAPPFIRNMIAEHFHKEHMSPEEVGLLASRAGVKALVLTHNALPDEDIAAAGRTIAEHYSGPVTFAHDLDRF